ncbi:hypothetical protein ABIC09_005842 [Bradyrhizobium sp. S3.12.5]
MRDQTRLCATRSRRPEDARSERRLAAAIPAYTRSCALSRPLRSHVGKAPHIRHGADLPQAGWLCRLCAPGISKRGWIAEPRRRPAIPAQDRCCRPNGTHPSRMQAKSGADLCRAATRPHANSATQSATNSILIAYPCFSPAKSKRIIQIDFRLNHHDPRGSRAGTWHDNHLGRRRSDLGCVAGGRSPRRRSEDVTTHGRPRHTRQVSRICLLKQASRFRGSTGGGRRWPRALRQWSRLPAGTVGTFARARTRQTGERAVSGSVEWSFGR